MKTALIKKRDHALTLVEVLVVIVVLVVIAAIVLPAFRAAHSPTMPIRCINNLKQIGLAYITWAGDNNDKFPMEISVTNEGTMELAATGNVVATFQIMSNELNTPRLLICPEDKGRITANNFAADFNNSRISYFIGLDASTNFPQAFLSGDDNFEISAFLSNPACWNFQRTLPSLGQQRGITASATLVLPMAAFKN